MNGDRISDDQRELFHKMFFTGRDGIAIANTLRRSTRTIYGYARRNGYSFRDRAGPEEVPPSKPCGPVSIEQKTRERQAFYDALTPSDDGKCSVPACNRPRQHNKHGLCSECDQERINLRTRVRVNMRSLS